ncbi:MAG: hypothetical protein JST32_20565 [Bacteroidetes bacterium]|nr:hypothetical protein [Bacteroidota bacterium]
MRHTVLIVFLSLLSFTAQSQEIQDRDQVRLNAIQDFVKTKLFKMDSVFHVKVYDTLYRVAFDTISKNNYRSKAGRAYPEIIAVDILGSSYKYVLDTTTDLNTQKGIPSRFLEQNGKLFIWYDDHHPLMDSTIKMLDKYHLIVRGRKGDWDKLVWGTDDAKKGATYYFCRSNLTVFRRIITSAGTGWYDPPKIKCK